MANVLDAIQNILENDSAVVALLDDKFEPGRTTQGVQPPFCIYKTQDSDPTNTKDGPSELDVDRLIIAFWSEKETERSDIREAIRTALDRFSGTNSGVVIDKIIFENKQDFFDEDLELYQGEDDYRIRTKR